MAASHQDQSTGGAAKLELLSVEKESDLSRTAILIWLDVYQITVTQRTHSPPSPVRRPFHLFPVESGAPKPKQRSDFLRQVRRSEFKLQQLLIPKKVI